MRQAVLLSLSHRGEQQGSERLGSCPKSPSSCGTGNDAQPCLWPLPYTPFPLFEALFHGVPKPCALMAVGGYWFCLHFPCRPLEAPLWAPAPTPTTTAPTSQSSHSNQGLKAIPTPLYPLYFDLGNSSSLFNTYLCFTTIRLTEIRKLDQAKWSWGYRDKVPHV